MAEKRGSVYQEESVWERREMNPCESPYFSIVTPVYNAASFLKDTVQCIVQQSFPDFELILVDDQSKDCSWEICEDLAAKDSRVKCFRTMVNGGAAAARNLGLAHLHGQYLLFIDADDEVPPDYLQKLHDYLAEADYDCIKFGLTEVYFDEEDCLIRKYECHIVSGIYQTSEEIFRQMVSLELIPAFGYLWNSIYKIRLIQEHHLFLNPDLSVNEDFDFNIRYFKYVESLRCIDYCGYIYAKRIHGNSLSTAHNDRYYVLHMMKIKQFLSLYDEMQPADSKILSAIFWMYTRFIYSTIQRAMDDGKDATAVLSQIKKSDLFLRFKEVPFAGLSGKATTMVELLRQLPSPVFLSAVSVIGAVKKNCPGIFAMIKR